MRPPGVAALSPLLWALAWLGRRRSRAVALLVVLGVALPPLGELLKPYVTHAVMAVLCIAFMRIDADEFRTLARRPALVLTATAWTMIVVPLLFASASLLAGADTGDLFLGLMLQVLTPPIMSGPALAALIGLDATLVLATLIVSTALAPLSAPLLAAAVGLEVPIEPVDLGLTLFAILAGSAAIGLTLRRVAGPALIARRRDEIDGINIIVLFVFVSAVMGGFGAQIWHDPAGVAQLTLLAFLVFLVLLATTHLLFARVTSRERALALALGTSQKNMGLMLAGTGSLTPDVVWLYFAAAQFPIYLSPLLLQPVAKRVRKPGGSGG